MIGLLILWVILVINCFKFDICLFLISWDWVCCSLCNVCLSCIFFLFNFWVFFCIFFFVELYKIVFFKEIVVWGNKSFNIFKCFGVNVFVVRLFFKYKILISLFLLMIGVYKIDLSLILVI